MKKLFFTCIVILTYLSSKAQTKYDTCQHLNKFEGNWKYVNGSDTVRINLRKHRFQYSVPDGPVYIMDRLFGWHEYKTGGTIIESNYSFRNMQLPQMDFPHGDSVSIFFSFALDACSDTTHMIIGRVTDYTYADELKHVWATLSSDGNTLYWKQEHREGFTPSGMTLPKQFALIRQ